jgi:hypothetical protein
MSSSGKAEKANLYSNPAIYDGAGGLQLSPAPSLKTNGEGISMNHGIRTIGGGTGEVPQGFIGNNSHHHPATFSNRLSGTYKPHQLAPTRMMADAHPKMTSKAPLAPQVGTSGVQGGKRTYALYELGAKVTDGNKKEFSGSKIPIGDFRYSVPSSDGQSKVYLTKADFRKYKPTA